MRSRPLFISTAASAVAALAVALPSIWWQPLNVDEDLVVRISTQPLAAIVDVVWGSRGGGPVHFFLEHATLQWPGGLIGLRAPSLLFFLLALPPVALVARELAGERAALFVVPAFAISPLAVHYSTLGRPTVVLLAGATWALWLALRAGRLGGHGRWALAGVALGALVYVHPLAPLYGGAGLLAALLHARGPFRRAARDAWPAPVAFALAGLPYYLHTLDVLSQRYDVGLGNPQGRTYFGGSVWRNALGALAPGPLTVVLVVLAALGFVLLLRDRWPTAVGVALYPAVPIAFFSLVPAGGRSAVFFNRYVLPALPVFLVLVAVGALALARLAGRHRLTVVGAVLGTVLAVEGVYDLAWLNELRRLDLPRVAAAAGRDAEDAVLFASTGAVADRGPTDELTGARPAALVANYVALADRKVQLVDETGCAAAKAFLATRAQPRRGVWLFYELDPVAAQAGAERLRGVRGVRVTVLSQRYVLARSRRASDPASLLALGVRLRKAWLRHAPDDAAARTVLAVDRAGLDASWNCLPSAERLAKSLARRAP